MSDTVTVNVPMPTDDRGMVGRGCPECGEYFKLKPGTGLPITVTNCPYCGYKAENSEFFTQEQLDYALSVAANQVVAPMLQEFQRSLKRLERRSRGSLIQFKVKTRSFQLPVKYYSERDLETLVTCDHCELEFAIYGVFAGCPDCNRLTAMSIFKNSLKVARKRLGLWDDIPKHEQELRDALLADTLSSGVAAFDGLGKRLREEYSTLLPSRPRNLFQNLAALDNALQNSVARSLEQIMGTHEYERLYYLFQVRHLWEHNFGEIDEAFIEKTATDPSLVRRKYQLDKQEVAELLDLVEHLGLRIRELLADCQA